MVNPTLGSASMSRAVGRNQTLERKAMAKKRAPKRRVWNKGLEVGKRDGFTPHQVKRIRGLLADRGVPGLRDLALFSTAIDTMLHERSWAMQESRAQRDISVSKQRPTQSRSVGPSISDAVLTRLRATRSQFEGYKPGQNRRRIELTNDAFDIAETSRQGCTGTISRNRFDVRVTKLK